MTSSVTEPAVKSSLLAVTLRALLIGAILAFYLWTAHPPGSANPIGPNDGSYYSYLAEGLLQGHTYINVQADPFLATMANPWSPVGRAGHGMGDVSYYQGHYYLYFGIAPALLLSVPFRLLTGQEISDAGMSPIFASVGFLALACLILEVRKRLVRPVPEILTLGCLLAAGLCNMVPVLLRRPAFWEVPISCGLACCAVGLACLFHSYYARRSAGWLAAASLALGLAVASRPFYVLVCPVLFLPVYRLWRESPVRPFWREAAWRRVAAAALGPAVLVGLGLATYNALRFGNPLEFGLRYQMWNEDSSKSVKLAWRFLPYNFRAFFLVPTVWSRYFPFVNVTTLPPPPLHHYGPDDAYGLLPNMPFVLFALAAPALLWCRAIDRRLRLTLAAVGVAALAMTASMLFFQASLSRYMVDFTPWITLLAALSVLFISSLPGLHGWRAGVFTGVVTVLILFSSAFNVFASFRHNEIMRAEHPELYAKLAHSFDAIPNRLDRFFGQRYGTIELKVIFPTDKVGRTEPLLVTGTSFLSDYVLADYTAKDELQLVFIHSSRVTVASPPLHFTPGQPHTVTVTMGSLYPPVGSPYYDDYSPAQARAFQSTVRILFDGKVAIRRLITTYDGLSPNPVIGTTEDRPAYRDTPFSGRILGRHRLRDTLTVAREPGPVRLQLRLPPFSGVRHEPLLSSGTTGRGDLVYISYLADNKISFGFDHWSVGGSSSPPIAVDPNSTLAVEIDYPGLHARSAQALPALGVPGRLTIRLNGKLVLDVSTLSYACDPDSVVAGANYIGSSVAPPLFTGDLVETERVPGEQVGQ